AASALAVARGVLPPTYNLDEVDPACPATHIRATPLETEIEHALTNSFGFGGQNVSLVLSGASTGKKRNG
ncbi:MAG: beta-ketoacyl synthase, partial [Actinophytocola sp.]|nr:beta-ketoacyl synthase [Actinophytocola sp.]